MGLFHAGVQTLFGRSGRSIVFLLPQNRVKDLVPLHGSQLFDALLDVFDAQCLLVLRPADPVEGDGVNGQEYQPDDGGCSPVDGEVHLTPFSGSRFQCFLFSFYQERFSKKIPFFTLLHKNFLGFVRNVNKQAKYATI